MNKWIKKGCVVGLVLCCMPMMTACSAKETLSILWDRESETEEVVVTEKKETETHIVDETVEKPTITNDISEPLTYDRNAEAQPIVVECVVSDGGTLSYQWYRNNVNSNGGGTLIEGAVESSFTPPTDQSGTSYYYVVVTNTIDNRIQMVASGTKCITITEVEAVPTEAPVVEQQPEATPEPAATTDQAAQADQAAATDQAATTDQAAADQQAAPAQ